MTESDRLRITIHMVGNAHIDPIWLWTMQEGRDEVLSTYRTALMMLDEFDSYVFTSGGSVTYQWVEEDDPALFAAIQQAVAQGRWVLVNGWWLQPDCNIPSGESFARHGLYGQRYLQSRFGRRAQVGYNVDSFGHAGTLPQLLALSGLRYYTFFRPGPHEKDLPEGPFWWEAPDGTRVLTCRPPLHYGTPGTAEMLDRMRAAAAQAPADLPVIMCFYGVGNHGGGPTRKDVQQIAETRRAPGLNARFSSPDAYFAEIAALDRSWPVVRDDLQHHARGCYTAISRIKQENRELEQRLARAERWAAWATVLGGLPSQQPELEDAWRKLLFNQFHDVLAGTSIREAYDDVWRSNEEARSIARDIETRALTVLSAPLDIADRARPWRIWNPLPWERTAVAQLAVRMGDWRYDFRGARYPGTPRLTDAAGQTIPCTLVGVELDHNTYVAHIEALVKAPALGATAVYLELPEVDPPTEAPKPVYRSSIDNEALRLTLDPETGAVQSLVDLASEEELLAGLACLPLVIQDESDTWSHDVASFRGVIGHFRAVGPAELILDGPTGQTLRVRSAWGRSSLVQEFTLRPGVAAVEVTLTVDWREELKMLKLAFPLAIQESTVTASAPYGWITRPANGEEEPCQAWVDLSGAAAQGRRGLTVLNDGRYGYDALAGELRLSVLRSPIYAFHLPRTVVPGVTYHVTDQGEQTLRYTLLPHAGDWREVLVGRRSEELHAPLLAEPATPQQGERQALSLLSAAPEHIVLTVVKRAEEGERLLVRGYEAHGQPGRLTLTSEVLGQCWTYDVRPHEIFTLELPLEGGAPRPLNLLEEPLEGNPGA